MTQRPARARLIAAPSLVLVVAAVTALTGVTADGVASPRTAQAGESALRGGGDRPQPLPPDLTPLRAADLSISRAGDHRQLRFEAGLANIGQGPMEVRPNQAQPCPAGQRHASQIIYLDVDESGVFGRKVDNEFTHRSAGCMVFHPQHNHWHFQAAAQYRLFKPGSEQNILVTSRKMSFCLRDSRRVPESMGTYNRPLFYRDCGRTTPQGISIGWVDVYASYLSGQSLTLPRRVRRGVYCLGIAVDPRHLLTEVDEDNNTSVKAFRLRQGTVIEQVPDNTICR